MGDLERLRATSCPTCCNCELNNGEQCILVWAVQEIERLLAALREKHFQA